MNAHKRDPSASSIGPLPKRIKESQSPNKQAQSLLLKLLFTNQFAPVQQRLMEILRPRDIICLRRTCKDIREYLQWDINAKLQRFFNNPCAFRSELGRCEALISGSFALQFFERVTWPQSDLDIFAEEGGNFHSMCIYLESKEGYKLQPVEVVPKGYLITQLGEIATFKKGNSKVQVMSCDESPAITILSGFYTSATMNIISWNKAYSLFPKATFSYKTYPLHPLDEYHNALHQKYIQQGWQLLPVVPN